MTAVGKVRALGTAFDVKTSNENMEVTVLEHDAVRVVFNRTSSMKRLNEGERVSFEQGKQSR